MRKQDAGFDFHRYRQLLSEAVDEKKRLAFIDLLIEERARERLEEQRAADRIAMTATTITEVPGASRSQSTEIARLSPADGRAAPAIARKSISR